MNLWQSFSADEKNVSWWSFQRRQKFSGIVVRLVLHYYSSTLFFLISASFRFCSFAAACCDLCEWATVLVVRWGATAVVTTTNAPLLLSARHSHSVPSQYTKHSGAVRVHRVNLIVQTRMTKLFRSGFWICRKWPFFVLFSIQKFSILTQEEGKENMGAGRI